MNQIDFETFHSVELRLGTVTKAEEFPEARKPAYKVWVDFGAEIGELKTSAQVTELYQATDLIGKQVIGAVNLGERQIGPFKSQFLLCGFYQESGAVVLAVPDPTIKNANLMNGSKLS